MENTYQKLSTSNVTRIFELAERNFQVKHFNIKTVSTTKIAHQIYKVQAHVFSSGVCWKSHQAWCEIIKFESFQMNSFNIALLKKTKVEQPVESRFLRRLFRFWNFPRRKAKLKNAGK